MSTTDAPSLEAVTTTNSQFFEYDTKSSSLASYLAIKIGSSDAAGLLGLFAYNTNEL